MHVEGIGNIFLSSDVATIAAAKEKCAERKMTLLKPESETHWANLDKALREIHRKCVYHVYI